MNENIDVTPAFVNRWYTILKQKALARLGAASYRYPSLTTQVLPWIYKLYSPKNWTPDDTAREDWLVQAFLGPAGNGTGRPVMEKAAEQWLLAKVQQKILVFHIREQPEEVSLAEAALLFTETDYLFTSVSAGYSYREVTAWRYLIGQTLRGDRSGLAQQLAAGHKDFLTEVLRRKKVNGFRQARSRVITQLKNRQPKGAQRKEKQ